MKKPRALSKHTEQAIAVLAREIKLGRKMRHWSEQNLAERAGITRTTLRRIEKGDPGCALGIVLEIATLVGIPLFDSDKTPLARQLADAEQKIALLPKRTHTTKEVADDDF